MCIFATTKGLLLILRDWHSLPGRRKNSYGINCSLAKEGQGYILLGSLQAKQDLLAPAEATMGLECFSCSQYVYVKYLLLGIEYNAVNRTKVPSLKELVFDDIMAYVTTHGLLQFSLVQPVFD